MKCSTKKIAQHNDTLKRLEGFAHQNVAAVPIRGDGVWKGDKPAVYMNEHTGKVQPFDQPKAADEDTQPQDP